MAFIDEIGRKISSGANKVSAQTKKMTETARINGEISANSAAIERSIAGMSILPCLSASSSTAFAIKLRCSLSPCAIGRAFSFSAFWAKSSTE